MVAGMGELEELMAELKEQAKLCFADQTEGVQVANLDLFPTEIVRMFKVWERQTGAVIYLMTAFRKPGEGPSSFDYASKNCGGYMKSALHTEILNKWNKWAHANCETLDSETEKAAVGVYPNAEGRPMLPDLYHGTLSMAEQKRIMRRYFYCLNRYQGGSGPAYQAIERLCLSSPGYAIEVARLPEGFPIHRDPKHWKHVEVTAYHTHIHAGQRGELPDNKIFQYRLVYPDGLKEAKLCLETVHERDPNSTQNYTRGELLRGAQASQVARSAPTQEPLENKWKGLPLARTTHVYVCVRGDHFKQLLARHEHQQELRELLCEVAWMEEFGPIHPWDKITSRTTHIWGHQEKSP